MAAGTTHKEASDHKTSHPIAGNKLSASPIIQRQHSAQRVGPRLLAAIIRLGSTESCDELYCTEHRALGKAKQQFHHNKKKQILIKSSSTSNNLMKKCECKSCCP